jgi:hypothetical protein
LTIARLRRKITIYREGEGEQKKIAHRSRFKKETKGKKIFL